MKALRYGGLAPRDCGRPHVVAYVAAMRPKQWTKNAVVFAAPLFGFRLDAHAVVGAALAFAIFCALASATYLVNDVVDVAADRAHPHKRFRPIAAGEIAPRAAVALAVALALGALVAAWRFDTALGAIALAYIALQAGYNLAFKRQAIVDVLAIATGFILRAFAGGAATAVTLSAWFVLCVGMLALFLAIEKRRAELARSTAIENGRRSVFETYTPDLLTRMESVATSGAVLSYAIWSSGPQVGGASTRWMMATLPIVLYAVFRYQSLCRPRPGIAVASERPEDALLDDRAMRYATLLWVATVASVLTLAHVGIV